MDDVEDGNQFLIRKVLRQSRPQRILSVHNTGHGFVRVGIAECDFLRQPAKYLVVRRTHRAVTIAQQRGPYVLGQRLGSGRGLLFLLGIPKQGLQKAAPVYG